MLRITVHDNLHALTFQLEGRLAGPWVRVLEECWQSTLARQPRAILRVDLTGVTGIDAAGQACLAALYGQGAEFIAADCLINAVVDEITQVPLADSGRPTCERENRLRRNTLSRDDPALGYWKGRNSRDRCD
jgi:ABC-type transporter Mla MlaB component